MRRFILLTCFCFSLLINPDSLYAQFDFAIQAGANYGSITYKGDGETVKSPGHIGIRLGLVAERQMNEKMVLHTGVIYSQKGGKDEESEDDWTETNKTTINYLDVPLLLKYNVGKGYIMGGITLSYALSGEASWVYEEDGETDSGSESLKIGGSKSDDFGKFDGAISVGVGYPINVKGYDIVLNAYYNHGILDIAAIEEGNVTTGVIGVGATYFFNSKKTNGGKTNSSKENSNSNETEYEEEDWR